MKNKILSLVMLSLLSTSNFFASDITHPLVTRNCKTENSKRIVKFIIHLGPLGSWGFEFENSKIAYSGNGNIELNGEVVNGKIVIKKDKNFIKYFGNASSVRIPGGKLNPITTPKEYLNKTIIIEEGYYVVKNNTVFLNSKTSNNNIKDLTK